MWLLSAPSATTSAASGFSTACTVGHFLTLCAYRPDHATGTATVKVCRPVNPILTAPRPAAYDFPSSSMRLTTAVSISRGIGSFRYASSDQPDCKKIDRTVVETRWRRAQVLRPQPAAGRYDTALVSELMACASMMKMNDDEVITIAKLFGYPYQSLEKFCRDYAAKFGWEAVCVTRGSKGCALLIGQQYVEVSWI